MPRVLLAINLTLPEGFVVFGRQFVLDVELWLRVMLGQNLSLLLVLTISRRPDLKM